MNALHHAFFVAAEQACFVSTLVFSSVGLAAAVTQAVLPDVWRNFRRPDSPERLTRGAYALTAISLLLTLTARSLAAETLALSNMYESLLGVTLALLTGYLAMRRRLAADVADDEASAKALDGWAMPAGLLAVGALSFAATLPREIAPLMPALRSYWRAIHVPAILSAYATLALSFAAAVAFLAHAGSKGARPQTLAFWEEAAYRCAAIGFPLLVVGVMLGALWANEAWGRYWSWDPKESMSLATLLVYGAYLHLRLSGRASARALAWTLVVGFALVLLTYLWLNWLGVGLHSYGKIGSG